MSASEPKELPPNKPSRLHNSTCPYCERSLTEENKTKEHVVGRNFVPRGTLENRWNLILNACRDCNVRKSDLEDDISALTMHPDLLDNDGHLDEKHRGRALAKANRSRSRRTGKPVQHSTENLTIKQPLGKLATVTFELKAPPQTEYSRSAELARLHISALFFFITYNKEFERGNYWPGEFFPLLEARKPDWGNDVHTSFMQSVEGWENRLLVTTADGYFKAAIRRHPNHTVWSWAVEWNKGYRLVGFIGEPLRIKVLTDDLLKLKMTAVNDADGNNIRFRAEQPISDEADKLFAWRSGDET